MPPGPTGRIPYIHMSVVITASFGRLPIFCTPLQCNIVNACYFGKDFDMRRRAEQRSASAERCSALQIRLRLRRAAQQTSEGTLGKKWSTSAIAGACVNRGSPRAQERPWCGVSWRSAPGSRSARCTRGRAARPSR